MPEKLITKIRTSEGDLQIDYNALANLPDLGANLDAAKKYTDEQIATIPAPSWNDLTDKPFYDEGGLEPITWDGNTEGKVIVSTGTSTLVKISDAVLTVDDLNACSITLSTGDNMALNGMVQDKDGLIMVGTGFLYVAPAENFEYAGVIFPEAGVYSPYYIDEETDTAQYVTSLTFAAGGLKTLDDKFIPDTIARVEEVQEKIEQAQTTADEAKQGVAELEDYIDNLDKNKSSSIDLSAFESTGTIVETFADGSTKTTTMEFDANGNPIKITDTNGNVTILTW